MVLGLVWTQAQADKSKKSDIKIEACTQIPHMVKMLNDAMPYTLSVNCEKHTKGNGLFSSSETIIKKVTFNGIETCETNTYYDAAIYLKQDINLKENLIHVLNNLLKHLKTAEGYMATTRSVPYSNGYRVTHLIVPTCFMPEFSGKALLNR